MWVRGTLDAERQTQFCNRRLDLPFISATVLALHLLFAHPKYPA